MTIRWTESKERELNEWASKCTNLHQLCKKLHLKYGTVLQNQELRGRLEWALMEKWGDAGEHAIETLQWIMNNSDSEANKIDCAKKLIDIAERQKDRIASHKIEIMEKPVEDTGLKGVYEKLKQFAERKSEPDFIDEVGESFDSFDDSEESSRD